MALCAVLAAAALLTAVPAPAQDTVLVPSDWTHKPSAVPGGAPFRVLLSTNGMRTLDSADIADYNAFVRDVVGRAAPDGLKPYHASFTALASTTTVDARDNTGTNPDNGVGVPIYWFHVNTLVATDNADLYDGAWSNYHPVTARGALVPVLNFPSWVIATGTDPDGTGAADHELGTLQPVVATPGLGASVVLNAYTVSSADSAHLYGLSPVFRAVGEGVPYVTGVEITSRGHDGEGYATGDAVRVTVTFNEAVTVDTTDGAPRLGLTVGGQAHEAGYVAQDSTATELVFSYTVHETHSDHDGLTIPGGTLSGGSITKQGDDTVTADTAFHTVEGGEAHRVNVEPVVRGLEVVSTPRGDGGTYGLGETIEIAVRFQVGVDVDVTQGTPTLGLRLYGDPDDPSDTVTRPRQATYLRHTDRDLIFGYVVAAADRGKEIRFPMNSVGRGSATIDGTVSGRRADLEHHFRSAPIRVNGGLTPPAGTDASLAGLHLAGVALSPAFAPDTRAYTATVPNDVASVTVAPISADSAATTAITPADADAADGHQVSLAVGDTAVTVQVTAADGMTTAAYTVTVTRSPPPTLTATLVDLPASHDGTDFSFRVVFSHEFTSKTRLVQGAQVTGGSIDADNTVSNGALDWTVTVTPESGTDVVVTLPAADGCMSTTQICAVGSLPLSETVVGSVPARENVGRLNSLALTGITLSPAFAAGTVHYAAVAAPATTAVTVAAIPASEAGTVTITPADSDDADGHQAALNGGTTIITITVTDPHGSRDYTVAVRQKPEVSVAAAASPVTEGTAAAFTLTRAGPADAELAVAVAVTESGSFIKTTGGYTPPTEAVFAAQAVSAALTVETEQDSLDEESGGVTVTVSPAAGGDYTVGAPAAATVVVEDDDALPVTLRVAPPVILENGAVSVVSATVPRPHGDPLEALTVTVAVSPVAPATGDDFTLSANRVLTFLSVDTESTGEVTVTAVDNDVDAPAKTFTVSGVASAGASVTPVTLTIADDEGLLTASFLDDSPDSHQGVGTPVSLSVDFSAEISADAATMRAAWQVTGGTVTGAERRDGDAARWRITFTPESGGDMIVVLPPADGACSGATGPICAAGDEALWTRLERRLDGPATAPAAPAGVTAAPGVGEILLRWQPPDDGGAPIVRHQFRQTEPTQGSWTDIPDSGAGGDNEAGYVLSGLAAGTRRAYQVRAVNLEGDSGEGAASQPAAATPRAAAAATDFTLHAGPAVIAEDGGTAEVTVTTDLFTAADRTVSLTFAGSATRGTDYAVADTLTLPARERSVTATLTATADTVQDEGESVIVSARVGPDAIGTPQTIIISEGNPLTAAFTAATPLQHRGPEESFTAQVDFNVPITTSVARMADLWQVTGGTVGQAALRNGQRDRWSISFTPASAADMVIELPAATGECQPSGGPICSITGELLQTRLQRRVDGPATAPGATTGLVASGGVRNVRLSWSPPAADGGLPVVGYQYRQAAGAADFGAWVEVPDSGVGEANETGYVVTGLTAGTRYRYQVRAVNEEGDEGHGAASATAAATPRGEGDLVAFTVAVNPASIAEADGGTAAVTVSSGGAYFTDAQTITLTFSGTATRDADYTAGAQTLTLAAGATVVATAITAVDDDVDEDDETVIVGARLGARDIGSAQTITITDDDTRGVTVAPTALEVFEGAAATYTVALQSQPTGDVAVSAFVTGRASVSTAPIFTPDGWRGERTLTVTADQHAGGETATVAHSVSGGDYAAEAVATVTVTILATEPAAAPAGLLVVAGEEQVTLSWQAPGAHVAPISSYQYRSSTDGGVTWSHWARVEDGDDPGDEIGDETGVVVTFLENRPYLFEVRAHNLAGEGAVARSAVVTPLLAAPRNLSAEAGNGSVTLTWDYPANGIIRHDYRYWTDAGHRSWTAIPDSRSGGANESTFTVTGLANGTLHRFELRAVNAGGASPPSDPVSAAPAAAGGICARTPAVVEAIVAAVNGDSDSDNHVAGCAEVTATHLQRITGLDLSDIDLLALRAGDFAGMTALAEILLNGNHLSTLPRAVFSGLPLARLHLHGNRFGVLPDGAFEGLTALGQVRLDDNPASPLPLTVLLRRIGGRLLAEAPAGAPFDLVLPVTVTNGSLAGGATTITIPVGATSGAVGVTRTAGTTGAVTATIGALPALPAGHQGYALARAADLPLEIFPATDAPAKPSNLRFDQGDGAAMLSWSEQNNVDRHEYRYRTTGAYGSWTEIPDSATGGANASGFTIPGVVGGFTYHFQVRAVRGSVDGEPATYPVFLGGGVGICDRTEQVRTAILALVDGVADCRHVTVSHLAAVTGALDLSDQDVGELRSDDLAGLTGVSEVDLAQNLLTGLPSDLFGDLSSLTQLDLSDNRLIALPPGVFAGLGSLAHLSLSDNAVSLPVTVALRADGDGGFTAVAPTGAPFELVLPVTVTNGSLAGGATGITIPAGALASAPLTVTRTSGTRDPVTVQVGTLPELPANHAGYRLVRSADGPPAVLAAVPDRRAAFGADAYDVAEGASVAVTVTVSRQADADMTIPLTATAAGGALAADYTAPASVTIAAGATAATFTVTATQDSDNDDGEQVTLSFGTLPDGVSAGTPAAATVSLLDDDGAETAVSFGAAAYEVDEGDEVAVTVTLAAAPASDMVVPLRAAGAAGATADDFSVPESVTISSGATSATFYVRAEWDTDNDDGEQVGLRFGTLPAGLTAAAPSAATVTIVDYENTLPRTRNATVSTAEDIAYVFRIEDFPFLDADPGDAAAGLQELLVVAPPPVGTLNLAGVSLFRDGQTVVPAADIGSLEFVPASNGHGDPYTRFGFAVSDGNGSGYSDTRLMTIVVTAVNDVPVVAGELPDANAVAGDPFSYVVPADAFTDADGDTLRYSATRADGSALPSWLSFDATTRAFSGTPAATDAGTVQVRVSADDGGGTPGSGVFDLRVVAFVVTLQVSPDVIRERDNPRTPNVNDAQAVVTATAAPAATVPFTVTVSAAAAPPAQSGHFSLSANPMLSFAAGATESTGTVTITAVSDEGDSVPRKHLVVSGTVSDTAAAPPAEVSLVIIDDDVPRVSIAAAGTPVREGERAIFTLTRAGATTRTLQVNLSVAESGAMLTSLPPPGLLLQAGATTASLTLSTDNDEELETDSEVQVTVAAPSFTYYEVGSPATATVTVTDDDHLPKVTVAADESEVTEGTDARFTLSREGEALPSLTVAVSVSETGSMISGSAPTEVVFAEGSTSAGLTVATEDDSVHEANSMVTVQARGGAGHRVGTGSSAVVTVTDDDLPKVELVLTPATVAEKDDPGTGAVDEARSVVSARLARAAGTAFTVTVAAPDSEDYALSANRVLTFAADGTASSGEVTITARDDDDEDGDLSVAVTATVSDPAVVRAPQAATLTIVDDEGLPKVELVLTPATVAEQDDAGTGDVNEARSVVTATLQEAHDAPFTVTVGAQAVAPAGAGAFTVSANRVLSFAANALASTGTVTIAAVDDDEDTADKQVEVSGALSVGATLVRPPDAVRLTIVDDDLPVVTIAAGTSLVAEGTDAVFTLTRAGQTAQALTVAVSVTESEAMISGSAPTEVVFAAAAATAALTVATDDDDGDEADSVVTAQVSAGDGYRVGSASSAVVTVTDDDLPRVELVLSPATVAEKDDPGTGDVNEARSVVSARLARAAGTAFTVTVAAPDSEDYALSGNRTLTFAADATASSGEVTITARDDDDEDGDLSVTVTGTVSDPTVVRAPEAATLTIFDDEGLPTVELVLTPATVAEQDDAGTGDVNEARSVVTATLQEAYDAPFTVTVGAQAVAPAGAGAFTVSANRVLSFAANALASTGTVTIAAVDDDEDTADKQVEVSGALSVGATLVRPPDAVRLTIVDDDLPVVTIAAGTSPVAEGTDAVFTLTRAGQTAQALTVAVSVTESGAMISGSAPAEVVFAVRAATAELTVATVDDSIDEEASTVIATVTAVAGARYVPGTDASAGVTVRDDDPTPRVADGALTLTYDHALDEDSVPAPNAFTVRVGGGARTVGAVDVTGAVVTLTLGAPVYHGESVTVGYAVPAVSPLADTDGTVLGALAATAVANDTVHPLVTAIQREHTSITGDPFIATLREFRLVVGFNKAVTGFSAADLRVVNGLVVSLETACTGIELTYCATIRTTGADGETLTVDVPADVVDGGNWGTVPYVAGEADDPGLQSRTAVPPRATQWRATIEVPAATTFAAQVTTEADEPVTGRFEVRLWLDSTDLLDTTTEQRPYPPAEYLQWSDFVVTNGRDDADGGAVAPGLLSQPAASGTAVLATIVPREDYEGSMTVAFPARATRTYDGAWNEAATPIQVEVDTLHPTIESYAITSDPGEDGLYLKGDDIEVTVRFSEPVILHGGVGIGLRLAFNEAVPARYVGGAGSGELVFRYQVRDGDEEHDGVSIRGGDRFQLADGVSLRDRAGNDADFASAAGLAAQAGHRVDARKPTLVSTALEGRNLQLNWSEALVDEVPPGAAFAVTVAGVARSVTPVMLDTVVLLILESEPAPGAAVTLAYTRPASGALRDLAGNEVDGFPPRTVIEGRVAVSLMPAFSDLAEGEEAALTVALSEAAAQTVVVPLAVAAGGGAVAADYTVGASAVTFAGGEAAQTVTVAAAADSEDDDGEYLTLTLGALPEGYTAGIPSAAVVTILDDDGMQVAVRFGASSYTADEGGSAAVTVALESAAVAETVIPLVATAGGGAVAADYTVGASAVTFAAGEAAQTVMVAATDDDEDDDGEYLTLRFGTLPAAITPGSPSTATVALRDTDNAPPAAADSRVTTPEDTSYVFHVDDFQFRDTDPEDAAAGLQLLRVLTLPEQGELRLGESAVVERQVLARDDVGSLVFEPAADGYGDPYATFKFLVGDGTDPSPRYTMTIVVTPAADAPIVADPLPDWSTLVGTPFSYVVPEAAFTDVDGDALYYEASAEGGGDLPGWLAFDSPTRSFSGTPGAGDLGTVAVTVTASDAAGNAASDTFSIEVNAFAVTLELAPAVIDERDDPDTPAIDEARSVVTATARPAATVPFTVTVGAAAQAPADAGDFLLSANRVLTFTAGAADSGGTVTITAVDDDEDTPDKGVWVSGTVSYVAAAPPAPLLLTIVDDDLPVVTVAAGTSPVAEGTDAVFTLTRAGQTAQALTVAVSVTESEAMISGSAPTEVVFAAAAATAALTVATDDDDGDEADSVVTAQVSAGEGYRVGSASSAVVTVTDDDLPRVELVLSPATVAEKDDPGTGDVNEARSVVSARLARAAGTAFTVTVAAPDAEDYALSANRTLTFAADGTASSGEVTITARDDDDEDGDLSVTVTGTVSDPTVVRAPEAATLTIFDDEGLPKVTLVLTPATVAEQDDAETDGVNEARSVVTATLQEAYDAPFTVTVGAQAVAPAGAGAFTLSANKVLSFAANERASTGVVTITAVDDDEDTADKQVQVSGAVSVEPTEVRAPQPVTLTIADDDLPVVELVLTPATVAEKDDPGTGDVNEARSVVSAHGAAAADGEDDPEGYLLEKVRTDLGYRGRVVLSLDLHANFTRRMLRHADAVTAYRTFPHMDFTATGERAAHLALHPGPFTRAAAKVSALMPPTNSTHFEGHLCDLLTRAHELERRHEDVLDVCILPVQPWMDIDELGSSVVVTATGGRRPPR